MTSVQLLAWLGAAERSSRFRRLAPLALAVLLFGLGCAIRLPGMLQQQGEEEGKHAELTRQQAATQAQIAELQGVRAQLASDGQRLQKAQWQLAAGESMSDLLDRLSVSGREHGLLVERLDVHEQQQRQGFSVVPLKLQVVGSYPALRGWLDEWLGQARVMRGRSMRLAAGDGEPGLLRLQLRVDAYHAPVSGAAVAMLARLPARPATRAPALDPFAALATHLSAGLTRAPLAQMEMVGSLTRGQEHQALLRAAGRLYRVRLGDRVGRDQGIVMHIGQRQVEVRERLFMAGVWHERTAFITLAKRLGKEAPDQNEKEDDLSAGGPAAHASGGRDALPG